MTKFEKLHLALQTELSLAFTEVTLANDELTAVCDASHLLSTLEQLKIHKTFYFNQLIDICAVDYLTYGKADWETDNATMQGFSRGVNPDITDMCDYHGPRFAVVYHLLSTKLNHRLRVKVFIDETHPVIPTVCDIWKAANWFEREAYDLYGILFEGHPDLRRILTDYGFIGHPFRKDFPVSGYVEMRYDKTLSKVIYEAVNIEPRVLVPKVIREDNRYLEKDGVKHD